MYLFNRKQFPWLSEQWKRSSLSEYPSTPILLFAIGAYVYSQLFRYCIKNINKRNTKFICKAIENAIYTLHKCLDKKICSVHTIICIKIQNNMAKKLIKRHAIIVCAHLTSRTFFSRFYQQNILIIIIASATTLFREVSFKRMV